MISHFIENDKLNLYNNLKCNNRVSNPILDYNSFFSERKSSLSFQESVRSKVFFSLDDYSCFGVGEPSNECYPVEEMKIKIKNFEKEIVFNNQDIHYMQSYSKIPGHPKLIQWLYNLQKLTHGLDDENTFAKEWKVLLTHGAQGGLDCIFKALFDRNDSIITEMYTYGGVFGFCIPHGVNYVGIEMDDRGIIPKCLDDVLKNWKVVHKNFNFPKAIYLIPNAQNPTGIQYDIKRKLEIYNICSKYNLLIIEDDPNQFLQLEGEQEDESGIYIGEQSFLKIDIDKRVIRLDTFSKLLSSGLRFGFITTWKELYEPIAAEVGNTLISTSNLSQIIVFKILESWKMEGFLNNVKRIQQITKKKRDIMKSMFDKYLKGLVEYNNPKGGLCFWVKLIGVNCSNSFITNYLYPNKILINMGVNFFSNPNQTTSYCRFSYTLVQDEQLEESFKIIKSSLIKYKNDNK